MSLQQEYMRIVSLFMLAWPVYLVGYGRPSVKQGVHEVDDRTSKAIEVSMTAKPVEVRRQWTLRDSIGATSLESTPQVWEGAEWRLSIRDFLRPEGGRAGPLDSKATDRDEDGVLIERALPCVEVLRNGRWTPCILDGATLHWRSGGVHLVDDPPQSQLDLVEEAAHRLLSPIGEDMYHPLLEPGKLARDEDGLRTFWGHVVGTIESLAWLCQEGEVWRTPECNPTLLLSHVKWDLDDARRVSGGSLGFQAARALEVVGRVDTILDLHSVRIQSWWTDETLDADVSVLGSISITLCAREREECEPGQEMSADGIAFHISYDLSLSYGHTSDATTTESTAAIEGRVIGLIRIQ